MFSSVTVKILFIEYKYFGLNINTFLKYEIPFIEYKYFSNKYEYILLNTNTSF